MFVFLLFISDYESNVFKKKSILFWGIFFVKDYMENLLKKKKKDHHYFKEDHTDLWEYEYKNRNER